MAEDSRVDQLLDQWEELQGSYPELSLERFIQDQLFEAENDLVEEFRQRAQELALIDRKLQQVAGPSPILDHAPSQDYNEWRLSGLQAGLEPIPGYTLVSRLGGGGFGEVWKAESPGGFHIALKFVQIGSRVGEIEERSLDVIKDVRHPHLLSVFGTWRTNDLLIIATELADRTLLDRFHEARKEGLEGIPKNELLEYFAEAAEGIDALNDPGKSGRMRIQHGDIKPQNLLLSGGSVKVGDFGLARPIQFDVTRNTGSLTLAYAAPECFDGTTSNRSDQYSLAITYCHLRGGQLPFHGTHVEIIEGHRKKQPDLSMIHPEERAAVAKALAKLPKDRWNSCSEFVRHLALPAPMVAAPAYAPALTNDSLRTWMWLGAAVLPLLLLFSWLSGQYNASDYDPLGTAESRQEPKNAIANTTEKDARPRVAVLYFENHSADQKELDSLRKGLCSMMITRLDAKGEYNIVERARLEEVLNELKLSRSAMFDQRQATRIGHLVGAQQLILGSYFRLLNVFRIDARLVDVETGVTIATAGAEGTPEDFSGLLNQLVERLNQGRAHPGDLLHQQGAAGQTSKKTNDTQVSVRLALALGTAVDSYDRGDLATALAMVDAVIQSNPAFEDAKRLRRYWTATPKRPEGESQK